PLLDRQEACGVGRHVLERSMGHRALRSSDRGSCTLIDLSEPRVACAQNFGRDANPEIAFCVFSRITLRSTLVSSLTSCSWQSSFGTSIKNRLGVRGTTWPRIERARDRHKYKRF